MTRKSAPSNQIFLQTTLHFGFFQIKPYVGLIPFFSSPEPAIYHVTLDKSTYIWMLFIEKWKCCKDEVFQNYCLINSFNYILFKNDSNENIKNIA